MHIVKRCRIFVNRNINKKLTTMKTTTTTTTFTTENHNASFMHDLLMENEFYNFTMKDGDFRTSFTFENLTEDEEDLLDDLFSN